MSSPMLYLFLISLASSLGCVKKRVDQVDIKLPESKGTGLAFELIDPQGAAVKVEVAAPSSEVFQESYRLPSFSMTFGENDYVKILRCQASYREYLDYSLSQVNTNKVNSRKWIWTDSFGDSKNCKVASNRFNSTDFQDLGAKNGQFFYLINPCVSASISINGKDECSYHLTLTENLDYKDSPSTQVLQQSMELADAESAYDAIISRLLGLSRAVLNERERCEQAINKAQSQANADSFGWDLLSTAIAVSGAFGARAWISKRSLNTATNYIKKYRTLSKTQGFLQSVANASNFNKNLFTAGFFASALGISTLVRSLKSNKHAAADDPSCQRAEELSQEIIKIQDEKSLRDAMNEIIRVSAGISQVDKTFNAYGQGSFDMPSAP
ncbi:MAG: hypothetical protein HRU09_13500 [Oligoflexales bacterium]|nr:hypothetical protein [Oligoflexales bacterium]